MLDNYSETLLLQKVSSIKLLIEERSIVELEISCSIDPTTILKLQRKLDNLDAHINSTISEIEKLKNSVSTSGTSKFNWIGKIHKINFSEAVDRINDFTNTPNTDLSLVLLIQNSIKMGGKWCITRIIEVLKDKTSDFKYYPLQLTVNSSLDEKGILNLLGGYFGLEPEDDILKLINELSNKIVSSVQSGTILLIEVKGIELSYRSHEIICWLLSEFWENLLIKTNRISTKFRKVKFLLIFSTESNEILKRIIELDKTNSSKIVNNKIFELPMNNWGLQEISDWLDFHSGLTVEQVENLSQIIFKTTEGLPHLVYTAFDNYLEVKNI